MWKHYCATEASWISVDEGQRCNWCNQAGSPKTVGVRSHMANPGSDDKSRQRPWSVHRAKQRG